MFECPHSLQSSGSILVFPLRTLYVVIRSPLRILCLVFHACQPELVEPFLIGCALHTMNHLGVPLLNLFPKSESVVPYKDPLLEYSINPILVNPLHLLRIGYAINRFGFLVSHWLGSLVSHQLGFARECQYFIRQVYK